VEEQLVAEAHGRDEAPVGRPVLRREWRKGEGRGERTNKNW
jgi:hypothetical protein